MGTLGRTDWHGLVATARSLPLVETAIVSRLVFHKEIHVIHGRIEVGPARGRAEDLKASHTVAAAQIGNLVLLTGDLRVHCASFPELPTRIPARA